MSFWLSDKAYATVWSTEDKGKYVNARISTSDKKLDDTYENSNWFAKFMGKCKDQSLTLKEKDRITITKSKISNVMYTDAQGVKKNALNVLIFEFEMSEFQSAKTPETSGFYDGKKEEENPDALPF